VITFTGQASQADISEVTRMGTYTCLQKPVRMQNLLDTIENALKIG
jgi:DNA-binding NtrC family response regulator